MSTTPLIDKAFRQVQFHASYPNVRIMPDLGVAEVAFIGRSNSGKSTLLNGLCYQKSLARSGKTPGLTRAINVFSWLPQVEKSLNEDEERGGEVLAAIPPLSPWPAIQWIDLPGYGYAKMSHGEANAVARVLGDYLQNRTALKAVVLIIDPRRGVQAVDEEVLSLLSPQMRVAVVHTKVDKLSRNELPKLRAQTEQYLRQQAADFLETRVFWSSSLPSSREGVAGQEAIRQWLFQLAEPQPPLM